MWCCVSFSKLVFSLIFSFILVVVFFLWENERLACVFVCYTPAVFTSVCWPPCYWSQLKRGGRKKGGDTKKEVKEEEPNRFLLFFFWEVFVSTASFSSSYSEVLCFIHLCVGWLCPVSFFLYLSLPHHLVWALIRPSLRQLCERVWVKSADLERCLAPLCYFISSCRFKDGKSVPSLETSKKECRQHIIPFSSLNRKRDKSVRKADLLREIAERTKQHTHTHSNT